MDILSRNSLCEASSDYSYYILPRKKDWYRKTGIDSNEKTSYIPTFMGQPIGVEYKSGWFS